MKPTLSLSVTQQLKLSPKLQQSIRLLQLSTQTLDLEIKTLLEKNPFLEIEPDATADNTGSLDESNTSLASVNSVDLNDTETHEIKEHKVNDILDLSEMITSNEKQQEYQEWLYNRQNELSLKQHLLWQMNVGSFKAREILMATLLIDALNEEGYLLTELSEIVECLNLQYPDQEKFSLWEIETVLNKIQGFEPAGVAARNLTECLTLQIHALPKKTPFLKQSLAALSHLDLIGKRRYTEVQAKLNISEAELKGILKLIRSLNPKPGAKFINLSGNYIIPDLKVIKKNANYIVELNHSILPKLRLNPEYLNWVKRLDSKRGNDTLKEHFNEARYFLKSLQTRNSILLLVAEHIVKHQQAFFEQGPEFLQPLNLNTIALECNLHESTISRITTQKYMDTPQGILELKYFFSTEVSKSLTEPNKHFSNKAIQAWVKKLISQESKSLPLSDAKISKMLAEHGMRISRRTVTKYREQLKIPSSMQRHTFLGRMDDVK